MSFCIPRVVAEYGVASTILLSPFRYVIRERIISRRQNRSICRCTMVSYSKTVLDTYRGLNAVATGCTSVKGDAPSGKIRLELPPISFALDSNLCRIARPFMKRNMPKDHVLARPHRSLKAVTMLDEETRNHWHILDAKNKARPKRCVVLCFPKNTVARLDTDNRRIGPSFISCGFFMVFAERGRLSSANMSLASRKTPRRLFPFKSVGRFCCSSQRSSCQILRTHVGYQGL